MKNTNGKHGLNPTIGMCLFCGKETGETALLRILPDSENTPPKAILSYEPCAKCKAGMEMGVAIIAVTKEQHIKDQPSIKKDQNLYPTGQFVVLSQDSQICIDNNLTKGDRALCDDETFKKIIEPTDDINEKLNKLDPQNGVI